MSLHLDIKAGIKQAMLAKDTVRLNVLRGLVTAMTNQALVLGGTPQTELKDEDTIAVIKRAVKQRKDSIEQFIAGGRPELADTEKGELAILETFLPATMSKEDIKKIAEAKKAEMGITDKGKLGIFMGALMKDLKGQADGADVKEVVESLF